LVLIWEWWRVVGCSGFKLPKLRSILFPPSFSLVLFL
jgi:hypothetical protein